MSPKTFFQHGPHLWEYRAFGTSGFGCTPEQAHEAWQRRCRSGFKAWNCRCVTSPIVPPEKPC